MLTKWKCTDFEKLCISYCFYWSTLNNIGNVNWHKFLPIAVVMCLYVVHWLSSMKNHIRLFRTYIYNPNKNLTKFEPLKPSRSGDQLFSIQNIQGSCEAAMFGPKNTTIILKILILPVYIFWHKIFRAFSYYTQMLL